MAITQNTYTGNGSTVLYSFTFPYLETTDIKVSLNGVDTTAYTLANPTTVQFNSAPANGAAIRIYRQTDDTSTKATFFPGSAIRSQDLNDNFLQVLYKSQETETYATSTDASAIQATANTALANSNTAITTANAASATANGISGTATTALNNSNAAVSTANTASSTATAAQTTANAALPKAGGTMTGPMIFDASQTFPSSGITAGTTSTPGIVQLTDSTSSTSTTTAATPNAVKSAFDIATAAQTTANAALPLAGGTLTGNVTVPSLNGGPLAGARNILINGSTVIDQRNGGAAVALNNSGNYTCDRWNCVVLGGAGTGTATVQRVVDAPAGFTTSLKWTTTNAKTPAAADAFYVWQPIEGHNIDHIGFNTASAKPLTLSFWVKSSLTGTFSGFCRQQSSAPAYRSYNFTYTISSANTWEYKTVSISADPSSGFAPNLDGNSGLGILFDMGSGSTYETGTTGAWQSGNFYRSTGSVRVISTLNATWQVTGVQLETGTVATPFERRSYGQELSLCQRYAEVATLALASHVLTTNSSNYAHFFYRATKRVAPSYSILSGAWLGLTPTIDILETNMARWSSGSGAFYSNQSVTVLFSAEI